MKNIIELIKAGLFEEATSCAPEKICDDALFEVALESNITACAFAYYLLLQKDTRERHKCIEMLLFSFFCYLGYAEHAVYSHMLLSLEKSPDDVDLLRGQLWLFSSPDNDIDPAEFRNIAKQILLIDPTDKQAQEVLEQTCALEGLAVTPLGEGLPIKEKIKKLIENGRFPAAKKELSAISREELKGILRAIAHDKNICAYDFLWMLLAEQEAADLHSLAAEMFEKDFCVMYAPIPGANVVQAFHERRARELMVRCY